jgi:flagellar L-ring protein precursor FlgH
MRALALLLFVPACAHVAQPTSTWDAPPAVEVAAVASDGGIAYRGGSVLSGRRALGPGDLLTVAIRQSTQADTRAATQLSRKGETALGISALLGLESQLGKLGLTPSALISTSSQNDYDGLGGTNRSGALAGTLTVRVLSVLPGGQLDVAGRAATKVNDEVQVLTLRGVVDPRSVTAENEVDSSAIADLRVEYGGIGVVSAKQRPGWLARVFDLVTPF